MRDPELWQRLSDYSFDTGTGSAPFAVKLARSQDWSAAFTVRVIEEYRKFLYLTQVSGTQVTPSQTVDAAWHMHLTFTRDYWDDMCVNIIGAPVHHQPCAGEEEMPRYRDQFAATRALHEAEFGTEPPRDIWARNPIPRRTFLESESGSFHFQGISFLLLFALVCMGLLDSIGGVEGITAPYYINMSLLFVVFAWLGFGPRLRRKADLSKETRGGIGDWYWAWPDLDPSGSSGDGSGDGDSDGGGCGGCGGD